LISQWRPGVVCFFHANYWSANNATTRGHRRDNATGNFTKIVQRLPIKIVLAPHQPTARLLRVGLSVEATIQTGLADVAAASGGRATSPFVRRTRVIGAWFF
jgi:hypothetical protein